ncbi:MAG: hypothetical protein AB1632_01905 [Nitrospirota bacterium]
MFKAFHIAVLLHLLLVFPFNAAAEGDGNKIDLSIEEQNKEALETFKKILGLTENSDRISVLPQIETAYMDIINKYPQAQLTQECHWRLMSVYLSEYNPPAFEKAEHLRSEFIKKYPESTQRSIIEDTLADGYYKNAKWEKLLRFYTPVIRQFVEKGVLMRPGEMFMYSEAKFKLGDLVESEKGYKIVIGLFPGTKEALKSKERLEEIDRIKTKHN